MEHPNTTSETTAMSHSILSKLQQSAATTSTAATVAVRLYVIRHGETNWNKRGKIQGGGYDVPLNQNGKDQAEMTARALDGIQFDAIASSAMLRAKETADLLLSHHSAAENNSRSSNSSNNNNNNDKKPIRIVDDGFNEMRFGKFEGLSRDDTARDKALKQHFLDEKRKVWEDPTYPFPAVEDGKAIHPDDDVYRIEGSGNGESTKLVEERTMKALSSTIQKVLKEAKDTSTTTKHVVIVSHGRTNKVLIGGMLGDGSARSIAQSNANINVLDHPGWSSSGAASLDAWNAQGGWIPRIINYTDHVEDTITAAERP